MERERKISPEMLNEAYVENFIRKIEEKNSKIDSREESDDKTIIKTKEGEKFTIEQLTHLNKEGIAKSHGLLEQNLPPSEVDSKATIEAALQEKVVGDEEGDFPEPKLSVHNVEKNGEVAATTHSSVLTSFNESANGDFEPTDKKFIIGHYLVARENDQRKGVGLEMVRRTIKDAHQQDKGVNSIIYETDKEYEEFFNKAGIKRLYIETEDGTLKEVPYYQSILADGWNKETGKPKKGQQREALHLMMGLLDRETNEMTTEELMQKIRAIIDYNSYQTEGYFKDKKAHVQHEKLVNKELENLEEFLEQAKNGKIKLMSAEERWKFRNELGKVKEHTAAD